MKKAYLVCLAPLLFLAACGGNKPAPTTSSEVAKTEEDTGYKIFVTSEISGDLNVISSSKMQVISTVPLGKRPRGVHPSPDGRTIYVALSGSPPAGPGVDESTLPPPDKNADGIGVFDVKQNKVVKTIKGGSDPENFDISPDGKLLFVSNEDASGISFVDLEAGKVTDTIKTGEEPETCIHVGTD